jgi:phosphoribosylamine--glycine ligase
VTTNFALDTENTPALLAFVAEKAIDLAVIGPEVPLCAGMADALRSAGVPTVGPGKDGAAIEGSKSFAKDLMERANIPTAGSRTFTDRESALAYLDTRVAPIVVKADGLAAGKGVTVATEMQMAIDAVEECFSGRFGEAGDRVVIEDFLDGPEVSLLAFVDGLTVLPMSPAQDHKRVGDGDTGPNTGGMGVYSPVPSLDAEEYADLVEIMEMTARAIHEAGIVYRGILYGGFVMTAEGPKVLEYNARFGDPETQVLLPRLETDLAEVLQALANGDLDSLGLLSWSREVAVSVVIASGGYPGDYETGKRISGIADAEAIPGVSVYHAGTRLSDTGEVLTAGGRVLNVTAVGPDFDSAIGTAYQAVRKISFDGAFFRTDIAQRALGATNHGA